MIMIKVNEDDEKMIVKIINRLIKYSRLQSLST
jgi:hypothetical protein